MPFLSKAHMAAPAALSTPLCFSKILRSSATVRFRLSVMPSMRKSVPPGPVPS